MSEKTYNLQVTIDKDLELALKKLAKEDDRTLRGYCRRILQEHVKSVLNESDFNDNKADNIVIDENIENKVKKKKVGALIKK